MEMYVYIVQHMIYVLSVCECMRVSEETESDHVFLMRIATHLAI